MSSDSSARTLADSGVPLGIWDERDALIVERALESVAHQRAGDLTAEEREQAARAATYVRVQIKLAARRQREAS